jgi:hypothetical protein
VREQRPVAVKPEADFADWLVKEGIECVSLNPDTVMDTWLYLACTWPSRRARPDGLSSGWERLQPRRRAPTRNARAQLTACASRNATAHLATLGAVAAEAAPTAPAHLPVEDRMLECNDWCPDPSLCIGNSPPFDIGPTTRLHHRHHADPVSDPSTPGRRGTGPKALGRNQKRQYMKPRHAAGLVLIGLMSTSAFGADCTGTRLTGSTSPTLSAYLSGHLICAYKVGSGGTDPNQRWSEEHRGTGGGELWEFARGPGHPVDPQRRAGGWTLSGDTVVYDYDGSGEYVHQVYDSSGTVYFCSNPGTGTPQQEAVVSKRAALPASGSNPCAW